MSCAQIKVVDEGEGTDINASYYFEGWLVASPSSIVPTTYSRADLGLTAPAPRNL
jgi:hypothetical protein